MRFAAAIPLAVLTSAVVVPEIPSELDPEWLQWDKVDIAPAGHGISPRIEHDVLAIKEQLLGYLGVDCADGDDEADMLNWPGHGFDHSNITIYEVISNSNHTTRFSKFVDAHPDVIALLNDTKANYTLFAPIDKVTKEPRGAKEPSKEFVKNALKYHIVPGLYPARKLVASHTLATSLNEKLLGGEPQRLRISTGLISGFRVNFYSKIINANIVSSIPGRSCERSSTHTRLRLPRMA